MAIVAEQVEDRVYVVRGVGWRVTVELKDDDMEMGLSERLMEAATRGVEALYGITENDSLVVEGDTDIDLTLIVAPKDREEDESAYLPVPSHIVMANAGFHKESRIIATAWDKKMKELEQEARKAKNSPRNRQEEDGQEGEEDET